MDEYNQGPVTRAEFETVLQRFDSIDVQQKTTNELLATILDVLLETKSQATHKHIGTLIKMKRTQ